MESTTIRKVTEDDLATVERCAEIVGKTVSGDQWLLVWELLKAGVAPRSVLIHLGADECT